MAINQEKGDKMALTAMGGACPNCGGQLEHFGKGKLKCPFCDAEFYDETLAANDNDSDEEDEDEEFTPKSPDEIDKIVRKCVKHYDDPDGYGVQISLNGEGLSKEDKARSNFDIPDDETIYMIFDETMFGSCKQGYAITNKCLYTCFDDGVLFYPWDEFDEIEIDSDGDTELYLDDDVMTLTGGDACECTQDMLEEIQDMLCE